jgi:hypothetical protein
MIRVRKAHRSDGSCSACPELANYYVDLHHNANQSLIVRFCKDCLDLLNECAALIPVETPCPTCGKP